MENKKIENTKIELSIITSVNKLEYFDQQNFNELYIYLFYSFVLMIIRNRNYFL